MTDSVEVTPDYLEVLANEQDEAAVAINDAMSVVNGKAYLLLWDHGFVSSATMAAMVKTEAEREAVCNKMIAVCNDLAEKLGAGKTAYTDADAQTGTNLNKQMA